MKKALSAILLLLVFSFYAKSQNSSLHGKIFDSDNNILPGASVIILGTGSGVNANESGEYLFNRLSAGEITVQASFVGYKTQSVQIEIGPGENTRDFVFEKQEITLESVTVTSQKREQQIIDVPITMSVLNSRFIEDNNITGLNELSEFVPGLLVRMQGTDRPSFVIRGLTSDEVSPTAQPRVSVFYNNVPISRISGAAVELFDMQQIDVLKGPQGTLFGRNAQIGAIHFISKKPDNSLNGFVNAGAGSYNRKELSGAINIPVVKNKLLVRAAGIYDYRDGYIKNTFGGNLNGKNTVAGRFSVRYLPSAKDKIDLVVNYQKDDDPGLGFMSMNYPNTEGSKNPFDYTASLEQGDNLATEKEIFDATLSARHYVNENNFWTSVSSFRKISAYSRWDGDGTAAAAIDMSEDDGARQFYQEIRYNYSVKNRLNGSIGGSYWNEHASQDYWFSPNDQDMFHLFFDTGYLVTPDGQPASMPNLPNDPQLGPLAGMPLGTNHQEENNSSAVNQAFEGFADATYLLTNKLSVTGGFRLIREWFELTSEAKMTGGEPSTLGMLSGNYPNLFFKPSEEKIISESATAFTWRAGFKYAFNENNNLFAGFSKGHRPKVLQFTSAGEEQVLSEEKVYSFDLGFKTAGKRLWFDIGTFSHRYLNFQTSAWVADANTGEFNYIVKDGGKASAFGVETNLRYAIFNALHIFGNYAYINAVFADKDTDGAEQAYAGNKFRLTPDHSFSVGLNGRIGITKNLNLFAVPSWSYKTKIFFEDANTPGLEQDGYGLLTFRGGIECPAQKITLAFWASNLLNEEYIVSAGNTGSLFGNPTCIPGAPRMLGTRISWKF
ncbi:Outer membrane receptor proteins, mostly Fe transport [Mariniphaga anaerophila]|uniref:Outer membrane receptor proteins, mostly Fe transport n=1 Tax=Mariniphaga anaerophila TaxID=1484053 RepID=A0A1M4WPE0_9BACT|nr:TonB-dependent receptor [Mariniphaga anaerophila]SHE83030.1 Outer membrane receptor proteins, mostly Fe transport [Mariniphaga anaerophila]